MIRFENVSKRYSKNHAALSGFNLEIMEGETVVFLGKSGSGKTTALKLINRLITPSDGRVLVRGEDVCKQDVVSLRRSIGYAVQDVALFPHMNVEDNIAVVPNLLKWDKKKIDRRVDELLEMLGMCPRTFRKRYPSSLSGGQRQRVGVARALAADPPIILMDEPFGALDPITREQIQNEFLELSKKLKKTIVFVTHDLYEAVTIGDRIALLDQGKLIQISSSQEFVENPPDAFSDEFLGKHRFQLSLMTKTIDECFDDAKKNSLSASLKLSPSTSLLEALALFKEENAKALPVYSGSSFKGELMKEKLLDEIVKQLTQSPADNETTLI